MNEKFLDTARARSDDLQEQYERRAEVYGALARLFIVGSYACYLSGAISLVSEPLTFDSAITSSVIIGGGVMLNRFKNAMYQSQDSAELQIEKEQSFIEALEQELGG